MLRWHAKGNIMIRWKCPSCARVLRADDSIAGKRTRCKSCAMVLLVPMPIMMAAVPAAPEMTDPHLDEADIPASEFLDVELVPILKPAANPATLFDFPEPITKASDNKKAIRVLIAYALAMLAIAFIGGSGYFFWEMDRRNREINAEFLVKSAKERDQRRSEEARRLEQNLLADQLDKQKREQVAEKKLDHQAPIYNHPPQRPPIDIEPELRKLEADEQARRLGSLSASEYRAAQRALEWIKRNGIGRASAQTINLAALIEPVMIAEMQRILGEERIKNK